MNRIAGSILVLASTVSFLGAAVGKEDGLYLLGIAILFPAIFFLAISERRNPDVKP